MMHFHGEYQEDFWLWNNYEDYFSRPGVYIDVGCGPSGHASNTAWLRCIGWTGLHIDANPEWEGHWNGDFICAVVHTQPKVRFERSPEGNPFLSRLSANGEEVETYRLDEILLSRHVGKIGFLSIDVEGQETEVLKSMALFPAHLWPPFIISEYNTLGIGEDFSTRDFLLERGYKVIHQTVANLIYYDESRETVDSSSCIGVRL